MLHKFDVVIFFCLTEFDEILFQKVALGYLLHFVQNGPSNTYKNTYVCTTISNKTENTRPDFHLGAPTRRKVMTT